MRDRAALHLTKIDAFAAWATKNGWTRVSPKSGFEVLRLVNPAAGREGLAIFHARQTAKEHATSWGTGLRLVRQWFRERRG